MITLNNSNIDFGFEDESMGSKYSISLSKDTSNFVFRTDGVERMTIMKNGKVGIGKVSDVCDLDVNGSINARVYLIDGVDISTSAITGDTSNYVTTTCNLLIDRIRDTSNYVGTTSNILAGRISDTSNYTTSARNIFEDFFKIILNNYGITSSGNPISGFIGNYKYMIFTYTTDTVSGSGQTQYDINVIGPESGLIGEILMVGGGGAGGRDFGGGGGGGAVLYGSNISIPLGPSTIYVGRGATPGEVGGKSTTGFGATILGGGSATDSEYSRTSVLPNKANSGGGGAGGKTYFLSTITDKYVFQSGGSSNLSSLGNLTGATLYHGYDGGTGYFISSSITSQDIFISGRGGGAGSSGNNGGDGVLVNILGVDYYWGGGGGCAGIEYFPGDANILLFDGGKGGGGPGQLKYINTYSYGNAGTNSYTSLGKSNFGRNHTGGGGGGGSGYGVVGGDHQPGGNGGSGIIIIKYFPSSYVEKTGNILIGRINNTSNYVNDTSNILIGSISNNSNYVRYTSNILIGSISNNSNYVRYTCNILIGSIRDISNYVRDTSNILVGRINNTSNYVWNTSNILIGRINNTSNYVWNTSNILIGLINDTSNYVLYTSNILAGRINDTSNYVGTTSNILVGHISDTSNYVLSTSNILTGRISDTSNYIGITSDILAGRINDTSNYVWNTSNILIGRINDTSNYVGTTSNILIGRINDTSNYVGITSNILVGLINNTSNYVENTRDKLVSFVNSELSSKSQWLYNNNNIYYNAGNIGIGTANPVSKLNIYSDSSLNLLTLENKKSPFFAISPNTGYTESTTIEYTGIGEEHIYYKNIIFNEYSTDYPQIQNNIYSPYYAENPSGTTLLAWYKFDGDGNDSSTNNKHLSVISGVPTYSTDLFQGRRYVNTVTGSFKLNGGFPLNGGSTSFTISYWMKVPSAFYTTGAGTYSYMHQGTLGTTVKDKQFMIILGHANFYALDYYSNPLPWNLYNTNPYPETRFNYINEIGKWVHIVYVVQNNTRKIYRNGFVTISDTSLSALNTDANANFYIGSGRSSTSETNMINRNINISDLRIYSNALTTAQILQLYNNNIINFRIPLSISVNGSINNVNMGRYMITTSYSNIRTTIMVPLDGQNTLTLPSGTSTTVTIKYDMAIGEISGDPPTMIGTTGEYKYLIYTYTTETILNTGQTKYDIIVPSGGITCDILMVGGGGGGDGGGGGGGSVYYGKNVIINQGTYSIYVGRGGTPTDNVANSSHGFSTRGFGGTILGGQTAKIAYNNNTGSSAGANIVYKNPSPGVTDNVSNSTAPTFNYIEYSSIWNGNKGGVKTPYISGTISEQESYQAGGGGGAGTPAKLSYYNSGVAEADGGDGVLVDILGTDLYWGGGGGGAGYNTVHGNGGLGGGGSGNGTIGISYEGKNSFYRPSKSTLDAGPHTGGGGGGSYNTTGGLGGSGIIIIRYLSYLSSSSDIELVNGITNDDKINYKFGNYNGIFKITSFKNNINTDNLVIYSNGNVGIGTLPSRYRLEVSECLTTKKRGAITSVEAEQTLSENYIGRSTSVFTTSYTSFTSFNKFSIINICARFNGSIWITGECLFALNCDARIKEDIQDINDDSALQMILAIEPKTYKYIDKIENGDKKVYGFIAQQVQKVIPEAVSLENAYIPNIMILADYNNNIITLPHKPAKVIIKIKDKIKCYDSNNNLIEVEVSEIINNISFKIKDLDKKYTNNKIFVYGTFVNDFYTLSKEHIYTLNVGATQELYKQIKEHNDIIKSREKEINELERQNKNLNENYEMLLKEITLIKKKINSKYLPII